METPDNNLTDSSQQELAKLTQRKLKIRRRAVLLSIATIFSVIAVILVTTVVQEEISKRYGYEELVCQERDSDCLALLCPQGWVYSLEEDQCHLPPGWKCCDAGHHLCGLPDHHRCYNESQEGQETDCSCKRVEYKTGSIVTAGYKEICHRNMVWVEWRHKCVRRN